MLCLQILGDKPLLISGNFNLIEVIQSQEPVKLLHVLSKLVFQSCARLNVILEAVVRFGLAALFEVKVQRGYSLKSCQFSSKQVSNVFCGHKLLELTYNWLNYLIKNRFSLNLIPEYFWLHS